MKSISHRHTGLGQPPADVHYGLAEAIRDKRAGVLDAAYAAHPERFVRKPPEPPTIPETSWINRPDQPEETAQQIQPNRASFRLTGSVPPEHAQPGAGDSAVTAGRRPQAPGLRAGGAEERRREVIDAMVES